MAEATDKPAPRNYFPKVKEAREVLKVRAQEIVELYLENAKEAKDNGDHEVTMKSLQWLIEHMPADESGERMVETSVDKAAKAERPAGPMVQIGFALGGMNQKSLPPGEVIEGEVVEPVRGRKVGHGG